MKHKRKLCYAAVLAGIVILLGAAGGSDVGIFNIGQALIRVAIGMLLVGGGYYWLICA